MGNSLPAFASTQVDQESLYPLLKLPQDYGLTTYNNSTTYMYRNNGLGYALGILGQVLSRSLYQVVSNTNSIYNAVDGVEGSLSTISGKIKDYTSYIDGLEGYIDGLETAFSTNNTRLQSILTAVNGITTYNYNSVLNSILANTNYLGSIESDLQVNNAALGDSNTGIWGGVNAASHFLGLMQPDISSIAEQSEYNLGSVSSNILWRFSRSNNAPDYPQLLTINGWAYPILQRVNTGSEYYYRPYYGSATPTTIMDALNLLNRNLVQNNNFLNTARSNYFSYNYNPDIDALEYSLDGNGYRRINYSMMDYFYDLTNNVKLELGRLSYVFADADTIAQKKANAQKTNQVMSDFTGSNGASLDDFTAMKDAGASLKSGLNTNVSPTSVLGVFNNEDGFGWFSQATLNSLDSTGSSNMRLKSANSGHDTPLYDSKLDEIFSLMGVEHD